MKIDVVTVALFGIAAGGLIAVVLGGSYFWDYTRDPKLRSGEMAWARAIRLSWVLLLLSACALASSLVNVALVSATRPWDHTLSVSCAVAFAAVFLVVSIILFIAYAKARTQSR